MFLVFSHFWWYVLGSVVSRPVDKEFIFLNNLRVSIVGIQSSQTDPANSSEFLFRILFMKRQFWHQLSNSLSIPHSWKRKAFTSLPVCVVSICQVRIKNTHWVSLFVSLRIYASSWRRWTLLRESRSSFWKRLDPSVWWELYIPHCPGHLCRAGMWQGCVCPGTRALRRVRWPGLGWRVQV